MTEPLPDDLLTKLAELALDAMQPEIDRLRGVVERLFRENRSHERSLDEVMQERDYAQNMADRLASAIAPEDVLGEHSDGNFPWQNALDWAVEKEKTFVELEQQLKDTQMMRDFYQRSAEHLRAQIDAAIAVHERGEHNGLAICLHCASLSFPPPESGIWSDAAYPCQTLQALGVTDAPTTASEESAR